MTEDEAVLEGYAESKIVEVLGHSIIVRVHRANCPCERCVASCELYDFGDWVFVADRGHKLRRAIDDLPWIDREWAPEFDGALVRATWIDLVIERIEHEYGKGAFRWNQGGK